MAHAQLRLRQEPSDGYVGLIHYPALRQCAPARDEDDQILGQDVLAAALALWWQGSQLIWLYLRFWLASRLIRLHIGLTRTRHSLATAYLFAAAGWGFSLGLLGVMLWR